LLFHWCSSISEKSANRKKEKNRKSPFWRRGSDCRRAIFQPDWLNSTPELWQKAQRTRMKLWHSDFDVQIVSKNKFVFWHNLHIEIWTVWTACMTPPLLTQFRTMTKPTRLAGLQRRTTSGASDRWFTIFFVCKIFADFRFHKSNCFRMPSYALRALSSGSIKRL